MFIKLLKYGTSRALSFPNGAGSTMLIARAPLVGFLGGYRAAHSSNRIRL